MSQADRIFKRMISEILDEGASTVGTPVRAQWDDDKSPAYTTAKFGIVNRYDVGEEFPAPTLRPVPFKNCVDEILWIWQKKSNDIRELNSKIWDQWAGPDYTIGKAYGYQLANQFQTVTNPDGTRISVDQVDYILHQLKHNRSSRRMVASMYTISDLDEMNLHPCCYSITLQVERGRLNMLLNQRSQDLIVAGAWNVVQYSVLLHMFAQVSGLKVGELLHVISDCHIYDRHEVIAKELHSRSAYDAPKFWINPEITNFYDFTVDDFKLIDYTHNEQIKNIPVAV